MSTENTTTSGRVYWRSLDELTDSPEFLKQVEETFPASGPELLNPVNRRRFLSLMGASMALTGMTGCGRRPVEHILPYSKAPEEILPGRALFYATTNVMSGFGTGLTVETHEGRPTKIEGNPGHPGSLGATTGLIQGTILDLYDPDRLAAPAQGKAAATWAQFDAALGGLLSEARNKAGAGLRILAESDASPTLAALRGKMAAVVPQAMWHTWDAINHDNVRSGMKMAFNRELMPHYAFDKAAVVVSLDSDFLGMEPGSVAATRRFADRRRIREGAEGYTANRLYVAEAVYSVTGAAADHRLRLSSGEIGGMAAAIAVELAKQGVAIPGAEGLSAGNVDAKWLSAVVEDLLANRGGSVVVAGARQPAAVHALVAAINEGLGNLGQTVVYTQHPLALSGEALSGESMKSLVEAIKGGQVETLLILGGNPAFTAPADLGFADALSRVKNKIHLTVAFNETSAHCDWTVPQAHYLESWGDARAMDGTISPVQPMIAPLFDGRSAIEVLGSLLGETSSALEHVQNTWRAAYTGTSFDKDWRRWLHDGLMGGSAFPSEAAPVDPALMASVGGALKGAAAPSRDDIEVIFMADWNLYDGRFGNNAWLLECPHPLTKVSWDNVVMLSPATAKALGVEDRELVKISLGGREVEGPALYLPGMADHCIALQLGWGRTAAGQVGNGAGFDTFVLTDSAHSGFARGGKVQSTGEAFKIAIFQGHDNQEGRPLVREASVEEYKKEPEFAKEMVEHPALKSPWVDHEFEGQQWGLAFDLNTCIGCNACTVACQAENNIPVVGKDQVVRGRLMHWIRLDRYFEGSVDEPRVVYQPMACQHCEQAPCENVCPVNATVHSKDGLNDMVYNRCIGTRYCANNCPFKVRRFNFLDYRGHVDELVKMVHNPNVTVRMRGVMEKCSYCVQRIQIAKRAAKLAGKLTIDDGAITPACAQACPAGAIVFGDVHDPQTRVSKLKAQDRNYGLLEELNIRPRTSYLARIRNPNPKLG